MKSALFTCLIVLSASASALGSDGWGPSGPDVVDQPFRVLFATEPGAANVPSAAAAAAAVPADIIGDAGAGPLAGESPSAIAYVVGDSSDLQDVPDGSNGRESIAWGPLLRQSLALQLVLHDTRAVFEDGTWQDTVEGAFWEDYVHSVQGFCCWDDGNKFRTNWLGHPTLGSTYAFVFANNHRDSQLTPPGNTRDYWTVKGKQMLFSFAFSTYFELGPILSESAVGNIGLDHAEQTWMDIIVTPTLGTAFSVGEDLLRVYLIDKVNRQNHFWGATLAIFLNPSRSLANVFALQAPWSDPEWLNPSPASQPLLPGPERMESADVRLCDDARRAVGEEHGTAVEPADLGKAQASAEGDREDHAAVREGRL